MIKATAKTPATLAPKPMVKNGYTFSWTRLRYGGSAMAGAIYRDRKTVPTMIFDDLGVSSIR
jgi:hypothetical protein